jgi:hypothetical protein
MEWDTSERAYGRRRIENGRLGQLNEDDWESLKEIIRCVSGTNVMELLWCEEVSGLKNMMDLVNKFRVLAEFSECFFMNCFSCNRMRMDDIFPNGTWNVRTIDGDVYLNILTVGTSEE